MNQQFIPTAYTRAKSLATVGIVSALLALSGCANPYSASSGVYRAGETQRAQTIQFGTIESVRRITIQAKDTKVGTAAGAVVGGVAGTNIGKGRGAVVGGVLGAVAGGVAGKKAEEYLGKRPGLEITVLLDSGVMRAYVQDADVPFSAGERVRILTQNGISRVTR